MERIELQEKQREGRNKMTTINSSFIESGEYRKKFDNISESVELNRLIYKIAKKILYHRNGTLYEDMYWIDINQNRIIAKECNQKDKEMIKYSRMTKKRIKKRQGLLTIHSHPYSFPPSADDFNSNYLNGYDVGIICCHNGKIYMYSSNEYVNEKYYKMKVEEFLKEGYNDCESQLKALHILMQNYDIKFKEV